MVPFDDHLDAAKAPTSSAIPLASLAVLQQDGRQWALPIDAACQVASYRPDLLAGLW